MARWFDFRACLAAAACVLTGCAQDVAGESAMAELFSDATPEVISEVRPVPDAPNVLIWMVDDLGYGQVGAFGGLIETPTLDRLAANGLIYTNYHTTPICSASRAALLTGRNSHNVHVGGHSAMAIGFPGYDARVPRGAGTIAANLKTAGYLTYAIGKWDHLPPEHSSQSGPFTYWPSGQGFDRFYGFLTYDADNFDPLLWSDHSPVQLPEDPDYHLTEDMADTAIDWIGARDADPDRRPFFLYWATGAVHSPHQAPEADLAYYEGRFDAGWDIFREQVLQNQIALGIMPAGTQLPPRPEGMPAWDSLSGAQKKSYARAMEVFAAQLTHADREFGRMLAALEARGELDNTLVVVVSDNGASAEGAADGLFSEFMMANGRYPDVEENLRHYESWGGPDTYPHYPMGWAVAGNTPFQYYKQTAYEGGTRVPMIVSWPRGISQAGARREQYLHAIDIAATIYESAGLELPVSINGAPQVPLDGVSVARTFSDADAPESRTVQYYEMYGNRAIYSEGWKAVVPHRLRTWDFSTPPSFEDNVWQLFDLKSDVNELRDLSGEHPEQLATLIELFRSEAIRNNVFPLTNTGEAQRNRARIAAEAATARENKWTYSGATTRIPEALAPPVHTHSFVLSADIDLSVDRTGTIMAIGGRNGGMSLYLQDAVPMFRFRNINLAVTTLSATEALPDGVSALELRFSRTEAGADIEVVIGDQVTVLGKVPGPLPVFLFTSNETFDIGDDTGSAVSSIPHDQLACEGCIRSVTVQILN